MSSYIDVTISGRNVPTLTEETPVLRVTLQCSGAAPGYAPHPDGERTPGAGGRLFQNRAQQFQIDLYVIDMTVTTSDWDQGHYETIARLFRCKYLTLESIVNSHRINRAEDDIEDVIPYWELGEDYSILPMEVMAEYEFPTYKPDTGQLGISVTLKAVEPVVGVVIPEP